MTLAREELTERQLLAWKWALKSERNLFISGFAGTGKTAVVQKILVDLEQCGRKVQATAFTGIAAQKIGGVTTSRLLGLGLAKSMDDIDYIDLAAAKRNLEGVTDIILDEVSLCSGDFLELVDQVMRRARKTGDTFGGVRMIFSGDFLQLPPVRTYQEGKARRPWAFQYSGFYRSHGIFLNESMRQRDPEEIRLLNEFRRGIISEEGQRFLDGAVGRPLHNPAEIYGRRNEAASINELRLASLPGEAKRYTTLFTPGRLKGWLLDQVPIGEAVELKVGAPVILLANDKWDRYANGSQGIVEELGFQHAKVRMLGGDRVPITPKTWWVGDPAGEPFAEVEGLPLQLGWAATIHRAQGLTLKRVRADITRTWESGQAYVALSRTPSLNSLSLVRPVHEIKVAREVIEFTDKLEANTV